MSAENISYLWFAFFSKMHFYWLGEHEKPLNYQRAEPDNSQVWEVIILMWRNEIPVAKYMSRIFGYWASDNLYICIVCAISSPVSHSLQSVLLILVWYFPFHIFFFFKVIHFYWCMFILEKVIFSWVSKLKLMYYSFFFIFFFLFPFCF